MTESGPPPLTGTRYRTVEASRIVELLLAHGWPFEIRENKRGRAAPEAESALDHFVASELPFALTESGARLFDPVEVINFLVWSGRHGNDPTFSQRCVPAARRLVWEAYGRGIDLATPPPLTTLQPQRYAVVLRRIFDLRDRTPGERIRLRLPVALEDDSLTGLKVEELPPAQPAEIVRAHDRLDFVTTVPPDRVMEIGARTTFTCCAITPKVEHRALAPEEWQLYTRPNEGLIKISEQIRGLASRLGGPENRPWGRVRRFWSFIFDHLNCGAIHYDRLNPAWPLDTVLDEGWYDCQVGSALMVALCRASDIPARLISGYLLYETIPSYHTWLECWIDTMGWVPFDIYSWNFSTDTTGAWPDHFFAQLDHRMPVERPPRLFSGTGAVRLPAAWQMLTVLDARGTSVEYRTLDNRALVYREHIEVRREPAIVTEPES